MKQVSSWETGHGLTWVDRTGECGRGEVAAAVPLSICHPSDPKWGRTERQEGWRQTAGVRDQNRFCCWLRHPAGPRLVSRLGWAACDRLILFALPEKNTSGFCCHAVFCLVFLSFPVHLRAAASIHVQLWRQALSCWNVLFSLLLGQRRPPKHGKKIQHKTCVKKWIGSTR